MPLKTVLLLLLLATAAAGCGLTGTAPGERNPPLDVPASWQAGTAGGDVGAWLTDFPDPVLDDLIEEAVTRNFELRSAADRVRAARARARIAGAATLPELQLAASGSRNERGDLDDSGFGGNASDRFELRGQVSWEADLWGRLSDDARAARADWQAAEADYTAARLSLTANGGISSDAPRRSGLLPVDPRRQSHPADLPEPWVLGYCSPPSSHCCWCRLRIWYWKT